MPVARLKSRPVAALELMVDLVSRSRNRQPSQGLCLVCILGRGEFTAGILRYLRTEGRELCGPGARTDRAADPRDRPAAAGSGRDRARASSACWKCCGRTSPSGPRPISTAPPRSAVPWPICARFSRPIHAPPTRGRRRRQRPATGGVGVRQRRAVRDRAGVVVPGFVAVRRPPGASCRAAEISRRRSRHRAGADRARCRGGGARVSQQLQRGAAHTDRGARRPRRAHSVRGSWAAIRTRRQAPRRAGRGGPDGPGSCA